MATITDPARELAELCTSLVSSDSRVGDEFLAANFGVDAWSAEFYQILFCIVERADHLSMIVRGLELDADYREEAVGHIEQIKRAFAKPALTNAWNTRGFGASLLSSSNVQPVKMLSPQVRARTSYPCLTEDELNEVVALVEEFQEWLNDHQLAEQDFVRQALLDGLKQFHFRLTKIRWVGWGYTVRSLKDLIAAYKLLEGAVPDLERAPNADAVLRKGRAFFTKVFQQIGVAQEATEKAGFLLKAYGAISLVQHGTTITGLLTHLNG